MDNERLHRCAYCGAGFANMDSVLEHQDSCDEAPDHIRIQGMVAEPKGPENWRCKKPEVEFIDLVSKKNKKNDLIKDITKRAVWEHDSMAHGICTQDTDFQIQLFSQLKTLSDLLVEKGILDDKDVDKCFEERMKQISRRVDKEEERKFAVKMLLTDEIYKFDRKKAKSRNDAILKNFLSAIREDDNLFDRAFGLMWKNYGESCIDWED